MMLWNPQDHQKLIKLLNFLERVNQNKYLRPKDVVEWNKTHRRMFRNLAHFLASDGGEIVFDIMLPKSLKGPAGQIEFLEALPSWRRGSFTREDDVDPDRFLTFLQCVSEHVMKCRPWPQGLGYLRKVERFMAKVSRMEDRD